MNNTTSRIEELDTAAYFVKLITALGDIANYPHKEYIEHWAKEALALPVPEALAREIANLTSNDAN